MGIRTRLRRSAAAAIADPSARGVASPPPPADAAPSAASVGAAEQPEPGNEAAAADYQRRTEQETARFAVEVNMHDLPPIFHYWADTYIRPMVETFGFSSPDELFANAVRDRARLLTDRPVRVLSLGSGNCDTEVRVGELLRAGGLTAWKLTCTDLVPDMLERGRVIAEEAGLADQFTFKAVDINTWSGDGNTYDVIIASQFLHHVVELELLFERVLALMAPEGRFVTSDMIGRNGHLRWPEARKVVEQFWEEIPPSYRYHHLLSRQEDQFMDWDCSVEGFEGIRSQDVLPCLIDAFGFELFIGFGNLIDPFVDRGFGWNFQADAAFDRHFIDRVQAADDDLIDRGEITPTHIMAVMTADKSVKPKVWRGRTPERSVRRT